MTCGLIPPLVHFVDSPLLKTRARSAFVDV